MKILVASGLGAVWGPYHPSRLDRGEEALGGGEAALLRTAFELAGFGHEVDAFIPLAGPPTDYRGVHFRNLRDVYTALFTGGYDALCSWSDARIIQYCPSTTRRIFVQQLNDMPLELPFWRAVDVIVPASATHGRYLARWQPPGASVAYVPLYGGVVPSLWADAKPWAERAPVVSWWSSPDRGLHHLLTIWPTVKKAVPAAELRVAYHAYRFIDGMRDELQYGEVAWRARILEAALTTARKAGGVNILGPIGRRALAVHQGETKVLAQMLDTVVPTEGLGVAVSEGIAAGCWTIVRPDDAFREVYDGFVQWVEAPICDATWRARFADAVIGALQSDENPYARRREEFTRLFTWEAAGRALERACQIAVNRPDVEMGRYQGM